MRNGTQDFHSWKQQGSEVFFPRRFIFHQTQANFESFNTTAGAIEESRHFQIAKLGSEVCSNINP